MFKANLILRVKSPYGAFWGNGTTFEFRQFLLSGRLNKNIEWRIGDIYIGHMTPYTVYNPDSDFNTFESDAFGSRRNIVKYENFILGNQWRLQGVNGVAQYDFKSGIKRLQVNAFTVRTNATNNINTPDRLMAGARIKAIQSDNFYLGANYTGLLDVPISNATVNYKNNVVTGDGAYTYNQESYAIGIKAEAGFSNYNYYRDSVQMSVQHNDYFYNAQAFYNQKSLQLTIGAGYQYTGAYFTSPAAQTMRINNGLTPSLYPDVQDGINTRQQLMFDRTTDEKIYSRTINPVLLTYNPIYGNITPYGVATPNRQGSTFFIKTDSTIKKVALYAEANFFSEVVGEGITDKKSFTGIKGGTRINLHEFLAFKKRLYVSGSVRYEQTNRGGQAPVALNSTLIDGGFTAEFVPKIDFILGYKTLLASGNEYVSTRDEFNNISTLSNTQFNSTENIYSVALRMRMTERSSFSVAYYNVVYKDKNNTNNSLTLNQVFLNLNVAF